MTRRAGHTLNANAALAVVGLLGAAVLGRCAGQPETVVMQQPSGPPQQVTMPKATVTGAASGRRPMPSPRLSSMPTTTR